MAEKKKGKRAPRKPTVVESGRTRTVPRPGGIEWEKMSDGSYRYWLLFSSVSGAVLRVAAEPIQLSTEKMLAGEGLTPKDL